jgi:hypothetical protein
MKPPALIGCHTRTERTSERQEIAALGKDKEKVEGYGGREADCLEFLQNG